MHKSQKTYYFCNNCGKQGHVFGHCKLPITSVGIVAFRRIDKDIRYLLICRKDSLGFIEFLRGKYPLYNSDYIQTLINEMTVQEKTKLMTKSFEELWRCLWGDYIGLQYRGEERHAKEKFTQIKRGIQIYGEGTYDLGTLTKDSTTSWDTPEWGFPKGRRNYQESDLKCAFREFQEETGYSKESINIASNIVPFEEIFMGSNFKMYKHKYFLAELEIDGEPAMNFQRSEVSDMKWLNLEECIKAIRPYNLEKINLIKDIDQVLHKYRLIS